MAEAMMQEQPGMQAQGQPQDEGMPKDPLTKVLFAAMAIMYKPQTRDGVLRMLTQGPPAQALAQAALFILKIIFKESEGKAPPEAMLGAAERIVGLLSEIAQAANVQLTPEDTAQATQLVMQTLQKHLGGGQPAQQRPAPAAPQPAGLVAGAMQGA